MLCAHTVRKLKPGAFEQFAEAFRPPTDAPPAGWVRFNMLRGVADENEVVTFGFFDGTREEMDRSQDDAGYRERVDAIAPFVESVVANGVYEIVVDWRADPAAA
jgi:hypothetical protein